MESSTVAKQIKGWFFLKIQNILLIYPKLEAVYSILYIKIYVPPLFFEVYYFGKESLGFLPTQIKGNWCRVENTFMFK